MKKIVLLLLSVTSIINSCPSCIGWDHQRKLRRQAANIPNSCPCDCQRQYHTTPSDNDKKGGHWCRVCQHRFIPYDPLSKSKNPAFLNPETSDLSK